MTHPMTADEFREELRKRGFVCSRGWRLRLGTQRDAELRVTKHGTGRTFCVYVSEGNATSCAFSKFASNPADLLPLIDGYITEKKGTT